VRTERPRSEWLTRRDRRRRRSALIESLASLAGMHVLSFILFLHLSYGGLSDLPAAATLARLLLACLMTFDVALVVAPGPLLPWPAKILANTFGRLVRYLSRALLVVFYVATLPVTAVLVRRSFLRRRPVAAPWVCRNEDWRTPTWQEKTGWEPRGETRRFTVIELVANFYRRGNYLLLLMLLVILLIMSISLLSSSPHMAPFIYTLF